MIVTSIDGTCFLTHVLHIFFNGEGLHFCEMDAMSSLMTMHLRSLFSLSANPSNQCQKLSCDCIITTSLGIWKETPCRESANLCMQFGKKLPGHPTFLTTFSLENI